MVRATIMPHGQVFHGSHPDLCVLCVSICPICLLSATRTHWLSRGCTETHADHMQRGYNHLLVLLSSRAPTAVVICQDSYVWSCQLGVRWWGPTAWQARIGPPPCSPRPTPLMKGRRIAFIVVVYIQTYIHNALEQWSLTNNWHLLSTKLGTDDS